MIQLNKTAAPFSNTPVAATAGSATAELPSHGVILWALLIKFGGTFVAEDLTKIIVSYGGKTVFGGEQFTGAMAQMLNDYDSLQDDNGYLPIYFGDPDGADREDKLLGCIDLINNPAEMDISVSWDNTIAASPTIEVRPITLAAGITKPKGTENVHRAVKHRTQVFGQDAHDVIRLPMGAGKFSNYVRGLHITDTNLGDVEFEHAGFHRIDKLPHGEAEYLADTKKTAQAGYFAFNPTAYGVNRDAVRARFGGQNVDMLFKAEYSAQTTANVIADLYANGPSSL